jgi:hypothetical protein
LLPQEAASRSLSLGNDSKRVVDTPATPWSAGTGGGGFRLVDRRFRGEVEYLWRDGDIPTETFVNLRHYRLLLTAHLKLGWNQTIAMRWPVLLTTSDMIKSGESCFKIWAIGRSREVMLIEDCKFW